VAKKRGKRAGLRARSKNARAGTGKTVKRVPLPGVAIELSHPQSGSADAEGGTPTPEEIEREAEFQHVGEYPPEGVMP